MTYSMSEPRMVRLISLGFYCTPSLCATRRCYDSQAVFTSRAGTKKRDDRETREPEIYSPMSMRILKPMSLHLSPDPRQTTGMEVSIVALIYIHSTLSSPLQFGGVSSQQRQQMRRVSDQDLRFSSRVGAKKRRDGGGGTKNKNVSTLSTLFWRCRRRADRL